MSSEEEEVDQDEEEEEEVVAPPPPRKIEDPVKPFKTYGFLEGYPDDIMPGNPTEYVSIFEVIRTAETGMPLKINQSTYTYMYNIVERVYGEEYSAETNVTIREDINLHVDAFLEINRKNKTGPYRNSEREEVIPRQLLSYIMYRSDRKGRSIQAWIGYALQTFLNKSSDEIKTQTTSSKRFYDSNPGLRFTPRKRKRRPIEV